MALHHVELALRGERADVGVDRPGTGGHPRELVEQNALELVGDGPHDVDALDGRAGLAAVEEGTPQDAARGDIDVGVGAHDRSVLPAQLHDDRREVVRRSLRDAPAGRGGPDEADLVARRVDERGADVAATQDDLAHAARQHRQHLGHECADPRSDLGWLQDDRVARQQRGSDGHHRQEQRIVPRCDGADHPERTPLDPRPCRQDRSEQPTRMRGPQRAWRDGRQVRDGQQRGQDVVAHRLGSRLAGLPRDDVDEVVHPSVDLVANLGHRLRPVRRAEGRPRGRRRSCPRDGVADLAGSVRAELPHDVPRGRVERAEQARLGRRLGGNEVGHAVRIPTA